MQHGPSPGRRRAVLLPHFALTAAASLAEAFLLTLDRSRVLRNRVQQLCRCLLLHCCPTRQVDHRRRERVLRQLRELAALRLLVLARGLIADTERRGAEKEADRRAWGNGISL